MKKIWTITTLPAAAVLFGACAGTNTTPDFNTDVDAQAESEDVPVAEDGPAGDPDLPGEPDADLPIEPDVHEDLDAAEDVLEDDGPTCATIGKLRSTGDGPADMEICPAVVTYVSYLGYFIQAEMEGPAIMVYEGTTWIPYVTVGDEVAMRVTSLTTFYGTKEINGHGPVTVLTRGNDVNALVQDLSSGTTPGEDLESEIVRVTNARVTEIDGRNVTASYGTASGVLVLPEDSGLLCLGGTFNLQAVVIEQSDLSVHLIRSYDGGDFNSINFSSCLHGGREPAAGELLINEYLFDPADDITGDANCDGIRDANDDEFIEIVNISSDLLSLSGVTVSDALAVRHTFWPGTTLAAGKVIVVFGGGDPSCTDWTSDVQAVKSSRGALYLNNDGDSITIALPSSAVISTTSYPLEAPFDQSETLSPDLDDEDLSPTRVGGFVGHWAADSVGHSLFSPGTHIDGSPF
jgi:hypothetical protein